ncbi:MAG: A/G-specific adenine glycosylase [Pseudomonadota bacterium]|nr:A/G-specific adenine glycosylase [Pseudomonadota bacterium]
MHPASLHRDFAPRLIAWQQGHGRHDLPWQGTLDPYRIWLSEIMLQQTQVETVIPYYSRFLARFPDLATLAAAPEDSVMAHWAGLGYYSRARNLHAAAKLIAAEHNGRFPQQLDAILDLPGIGRSTAAAIAAFAFEQRGAILDGNVKRVLARVFGIDGWPGEKAVETRLWALAEVLLPESDIRAYTQGLMDLGATLCTRACPRCGACPFSDDCSARRQGRQGELPGARPKKSIPEKATAMLILLHGGEILLEKRPAPGIWGGLWSLPECPAAADPARAAASLGYRAETAGRCPARSHSFTHFRLHIQPWLLPVERPFVAEEPGRLWLALDDLDGAALPTPVRRILEAIRGA